MRAPIRFPVLLLTTGILIGTNPAAAGNDSAQDHAHIKMERDNDRNSKDSGNSNNHESHETHNNAGHDNAPKPAPSPQKTDANRSPSSELPARENTKLEAAEMHQVKADLIRHIQDKAARDKAMKAVTEFERRASGSAARPEDDARATAASIKKMVKDYEQGTHH